MRKYFLGFVLALFLAAPGLGYQARVRAVHDGDSITVSGSRGAPTNIRLYGIDAPEYKQAYGLKAKKRLTQLVSRRLVLVEPLDTDRYGRTVAVVRLSDGALVNEILVAEGCAWVYERYCREGELCRRLRACEDEARRERRGLWAEDDPERPWDWRKEHKKGEWRSAPVRVLRRFARKVKRVLHR